MNLNWRPLRAAGALVLLVPAFTLSQSPVANAVVVAATGTDASICNQEVSDATNVSAVRLAGGDCVVTFRSGTVEWTVPSNLKSVKILLVGGGGGGGGSYDTAGAGGGGGGQVLQIDSQRVTSKNNYSIRVAAGGAAGFHIAQTNSTDAIGLSGGNSTFSLADRTLFTAFGGGGGSSSRAAAPGASARVGGAAATLSSGGLGGGQGGGGFSGGGGGGSAGVGTAGNTTDPARDTASPGGAGTSVDISGTAISYGVGGSGGFQDNTNSIAGTAGSANTGNGGGGASVGGSTFRNGGAGGSGVVIIRYSTTAPVFSNLSISGNATSAVIRQNNTISATVNVPSLLTFFVGKTRIAGCISLPTSGSSTNNVATCTWRPTVKGTAVITVEAAPLTAGIAGLSTSQLNVGVVTRATRR
jgi:hypothetical protein